MAKSVYLSSKPAQMYKFGRVVVDGKHRTIDIKKGGAMPRYWSISVACDWCNI